MDNQKNTQKNKLSELLDGSLEGIRALVDANTIVGEPIITPSGTTIIPVSKVSIGIAGGGNDFCKKTEADGKTNFSGGGGTGVSMIPVAFLVVSADGGVELLNVVNPTGKGGKGGADLGSSIDTILEKAPDIITKVKEMIASKKKKKETAESDVEIVENGEEETAETNAADKSEESAQ